MTRTHFTPHNHRPRVYREGDIVAPLISKPSEARGVFITYCAGYLSHCVVQWEGAHRPYRIKVSNIRLVERPDHVV